MNQITDYWYVLLAFAGLTASTLLTRGSFFMLPASFKLPARIERALRYAPACALAAIITPEVLAKEGSIYLSWQNDKLWAVLIAAAVFYKTRNMVWMMLIGMGAFTVLRLYI